MAKNTNKRIAVKWVRDRAKSAYAKDTSCHICGTTEDLELHHLYSITRLLETWATKCGYDISTDDGILAVRDEFIAAHNTEIFELVYTLCNKHHVALHGVYGKSPAFGSESKQQHWIARQKDKESGVVAAPSTSSGSFFSQFI